MSDTPNIYDFEAYAKNNPFMYHNHVQTVEITEERVVVKVEIVHESTNLHGYVHGGLIYSMADIACGIHSRVHGGRYVTQSSHINYLSNVESGTLFCETEIVKRGRTMVIIHFRVTSDDGKPLADGVVDYIRVEG